MSGQARDADTASVYRYTSALGANSQVEVKVETVGVLAAAPPRVTVYDPISEWDIDMGDRM
jgi:hypothetical protein